MSYYCEFCNYTAKNSSNFVNHKKTKKHLQLSTTKSTCTVKNTSIKLAETSKNLTELASQCSTPEKMPVKINVHPV